MAADNIPLLARTYILLWLKHDKQKYLECETLLKHINRYVYPDVSSNNLRIASKRMITAFKFHDIVEDCGNLGWGDVLREVYASYSTLNLPKKTARYTIEVWKAHYERKFFRLFYYLVKEQESIARRVGKTGIGVFLAFFWFFGAIFHDVRNVKCGLKMVELYFRVLLYPQAK